MQSTAQAFCDRLGLAHPIIQAPMAGGATTPELVSAVCNEGALGSLAGAMLSPEAVVSASAVIRERTERPFNVNLFVLDDPQPRTEEIQRAFTLLDPIRAELGLGPAMIPSKWCERTVDQLAAVREVRPAVASFTFGILSAVQVNELKARDILVVGTATNVAEARAWEAHGADAICAQGSEAGAHRGTFIGACEDSMIGLVALVPQICAAVKLPVFAAGGIMNGRGLAAALALGASAGQLGTAFLSSPEAGIHAEWKKRLLDPAQSETTVTRAFSGRHARGLVNEYIRRMQPHQYKLPAYPITNALTAEIRQASARANNPEFLSLWAGQGAALCRGFPAADLVRTLGDELAAARF